MLGIDEDVVNLLAALVHLRICHRFIMKASDRAPHLEYASIPIFGGCYRNPHLNHIHIPRLEGYKRVVRNWLFAI